MRIFRLFNHGDPIKTRKNKDNLYTDIASAKKALKEHLGRINKKIKDKNLQLKDDACVIIEYNLVQINRLHL